MSEKISPYVLKDKKDDIYIRKLVVRSDEHKTEEQIDKQSLEMSIHYGRGTEVFRQLR